MPMHVMENNNELIPLSFLQSGNALKISKKILFKHPTIQEIFDIDDEHLGLHSEDIYYSMISIFLTDPYTYMVYLDDKGIDYEQVTSFDVFILQFKDFCEKIKELASDYPEEYVKEIFDKNLWFKSFEFFTGIKSFHLAKDETGMDVLVYGEKNKLLMDSITFEYIHEFIKKINGIQEDEKIYPEDEWAKQILIEDERERLKKEAKKRENGDVPKQANRIGNLISSITWACNGGITPFNRNQLHMYDLIDGIHRKDKLLNFKNTMTGLYSGCLDKKKIKFNELHWSS